MNIFSTFCQIMQNTIFTTIRNNFLSLLPSFLPPSLPSLLFVFLGSHPQHIEVPRLGVELELQLLAYTTAAAMPDPSRIYNLHYN